MRYCNETEGNFLNLLPHYSVMCFDSGTSFLKLDHKILRIRTDRSEQAVQTQISLLLMEQTDQGLHCLPFHLRLFNILLHFKNELFHFLDNNRF